MPSRSRCSRTIRSVVGIYRRFLSRSPVAGAGLMRSWPGPSLAGAALLQLLTWQILWQKSPSSLCEIEICNDRIGARAPLNRCCAFAPDLESMLRDKMLKILLQHNRGNSGRHLLVARVSQFDPGCVKTL